MRGYLETLDHRLLRTVGQQFRHSAQRYFEVTHQQFELVASRLNHASYQRILDRGFCWTTTKEGAFITRAAQIKKGTALTLHYGDGNVPVVESSVPLAKGKKRGLDERQGELF